MATLFIIAICALLNVIHAQTVEMHVNATNISSGEWVELTWSGVASSDRTGCWIGVYSPSTANVSAIPPPLNGRNKPIWQMTQEERDNEVFNKLGSTYTTPWTADAPIKYIMCNEADSNFKNTGNGNKSFTLLNMRHDVIFWLFYNGLSTPKAMAKSEVIVFDNIYEPMHVHIARTPFTSEMRVSWASKTADNNPRVKYNINKKAVNGQYDYIKYAESQTYSVNDMCGGPAWDQGWYEPGYQHTTIIDNLVPGESIVYYVVGDDSMGGSWTEQYSFNAVVDVGDSYPFELSVIGDVGATEEDGCHYHWEEPMADKTINHLAELAPDLVLHIGDLSYATGYESKWELFMYQIETVATSIPYMTGQGNHEQDWPDTGTYYTGEDSGGECGKSTETRFIMPTPSKKQYEGWYSIEQGPLHLTVMDTELNCGPGSSQYDWIQKDLASINRTRTPWVVFAGHRQMYVHNGGPYAPLSTVEPLLMKYEVDLALWGHIHLAQATHPLYNATRIYPKNAGDYDAPIHCIIGNGGQGLIRPQNVTAEWNAWEESVWGWNHINIANNTHLTMTFYDENDKQIYQFTIYRNRNK